MKTLKYIYCCFWNILLSPYFTRYIYLEWLTIKLAFLDAIIRFLCCLQNAISQQYRQSDVHKNELADYSIFMEANPVKLT